MALDVRSTLQPLVTPLLVGVAALLCATMVAAWACRQALLDLTTDGVVIVRLLGVTLYTGERTGTTLAFHPSASLLAFTLAPALLAGVIPAVAARRG